MKFGLSRQFNKLIIRRVVQSLILILLLIVINFFLIHLAPGDLVYNLAEQSGNATAVFRLDVVRSGK